MKNPLVYKSTGVVDYMPPPVVLPHKPFTPTPEIRRVEIAATELPIRCIGCRYHIPKELDGEGILCLQKDGKCPDWVIQWALNYRKNTNGKPVRSFANDEDLLETLRL